MPPCQLTRGPLPDGGCFAAQECEVCYSELPGTEFVLLPDCRHHFCRTCVRDCCEVHIRTGSVEKLKCLRPDCSRPLPESVIMCVGLPARAACAAPAADAVAACAAMLWARTSLRTCRSCCSLRPSPPCATWCTAPSARPRVCRTWRTATLAAPSASSPSAPCASTSGMLATHAPLHPQSCPSWT